MPNPLALMDHSVTPPKAGKAYSVMVPKTDADGLPQGGVQEPVIAVPAGTYWGWNLRAKGYAEGDLCSLTGSFVAFPKAGSNADSRKALSERYADEAAYRASVKKAAEALVSKRLMLEADVDKVVDDAARHYDAAAK